MFVYLLYNNNILKYGIFNILHIYCIYIYISEVWELWMSTTDSTLWSYALVAIVWLTPWSNLILSHLPSMPFGFKFNVKEKHAYLGACLSVLACRSPYIIPLVSNLAAWAKVDYSRHQNLLLTIGFVVALQTLRRVIKNGTVWLGVPCSSWIWMSRATTKRCRLRPEGTKKYKQVKLSNRLVRRLCYL